jgi:hypothetical protein
MIRPRDPDRVPALRAIKAAAFAGRRSIATFGVTTPKLSGRLDIEFTDRRISEIAPVAGLTAVNVRRIGTMTRPLPCGVAQQVTATVMAPEEVKESAIRLVLKRRCDAKGSTKRDGRATRAPVDH